MKSVVIGSVAGAVIFFLWGFVFWTVLPVAPMIFESVPNEAQLADQLRKTITHSGTYTLPGIELMESDPLTFTERHEEGPLATIFVYPSGRRVMSPATFAWGFLSMLASVFCMSSVLRVAAPSLPGYSARVGLVVVAGLIGVSLSDLGAPIWWMWPWDLWVAVAVFHLTGWILVGSLLAWLIRSPSPETP